MNPFTVIPEFWLQGLLSFDNRESLTAYSINIIPADSEAEKSSLHQYATLYISEVATM